MGVRRSIWKSAGKNPKVEEAELGERKSEQKNKKMKGRGWAKRTESAQNEADKGMKEGVDEWK